MKRKAPTAFRRARTPEEEAQAAFVACSSVRTLALYPGHEVGQCSVVGCGAGIHYRTDVPPHLPKICLSCAEKFMHVPKVQH